MKRRFGGSFIDMYRPGFVWFLVMHYGRLGYRLHSYTQWIWKNKKYEDGDLDYKTPLIGRDWWLIAGLLIVGLIFIVVSALLIALGINIGYAEYVWFGLAFVVGLPLVLIVMVPYFDVLYRISRFLLHPKQIGKILLCWKLESQVRKLRKKHTFKVVAVAGSIGKTSSKLAVAHVLESTGIRVQYQTGNYNDRLTVPLVFFGHNLPNLFNIRAWLRIFKQNDRIISGDYPYDIVVVELGTDGPGQLQKFAYVKPELLIVTAISAEHMEFFKTLDAVALEEMSLIPCSKQILLNTDDIADQYIPHCDYEEYGLTRREKGFFAEAVRIDSTGQEINVYKHGEQWTTQYISFLGTQGTKVVLAAVAAADMLGVDRTKIAAGLTDLRPMAGRMQLLKGIKGSVLIDDTYNAAPAAVEAALSVLTSLPNKQRIAVLGSMNELGAFSPEAHRTIGGSIDPEKVALVVTIGADARDYLAPAAEAQGCNVLSVMSPLEASHVVSESMKLNSAILFKGSQNGVFAEEALKPLLADKKDAEKLVRQSSEWMKIKRSQFPSL